jgi:hypothetical protein
MNNRVFNLKSYNLVLAVLLLLSGGCSQSQKQSSSSPNKNADPMPSSAQTESPSALSYGSVTSTVKKGVTTQADLISMFGGPNISTIDSQGNETWIYEKTSSQTSTGTHGSVNTDAKRIDTFFGLGFIREEEGHATADTSTVVTNHVKSLTVVIKFNEDKTVKDYSARASYF